MLIERSVGPADKVCGDFLGEDAIERLHTLGVDPAGLGAAPIQQLRLVHRDRVTEIELPFVALGLSRRVLDAALLRRAETLGTTLRVGTTVRRITRQRDAWQVHTRDCDAPGNSDPIGSDDVFLATGKHDIRGLARPGAAQGSLGMKMYFRLAPVQAAALLGSIVLVLFPGGYAGLQCVEAGRAVLCVAFSPARFRSAGGNWRALLTELTAASPFVEHILAGARPLLPRPLAVAGVPYGFLHRAFGSTRTGLFRLGDQAAVIPSLTGDGIAIALHSGTLAARTWLAGEGSLQYHRRLGRDLSGQMRLAGLLHSAGTMGPLQGAALLGAQWFPGLLRQAARATRLRHPGHIGVI